MNLIKKLFQRYRERPHTEEFNLRDLSGIWYRDNKNCPMCKSDDIKWVFSISIKIPPTNKANYSICNKCGYKDELGEFEKMNKSILRNSKIDSILIN